MRGPISISSACMFCQKVDSALERERGIYRVSVTYPILLGASGITAEQILVALIGRASARPIARHSAGGRVLR